MIKTAPRFNKFLISAKPLCILLFLFLFSTNASARTLESPYSEEVMAVPNADNEPPVTTATIGQPQYSAGDNLYIAGSTPLDLSAFDYGITPSGVDYTEYKIDDTDWSKYTEPFTLSGLTDGLHMIQYRSRDKVGNIEDAKALPVILDKTAPETTIALQGTQGSNGWFVSDVTLDISAGDAGSGVETIKYSINDAETVLSGSNVSFVLTADGRYAVGFFAVDHIGNTEEQRTVTVNIDKTPPTVTLTASPNILWPPNHKMVDIKIDGSAADEMSGIASVVITVTDEYGTYNMTVPGFGSTIQLEAWREGTDTDGRIYTIKAVAADSAGNQSSNETTVIVPHDMR